MRRRMIAALFVVGVPRAVLACPVCFGESNAPLAIAAKTGLLMMLGVVAMVLAGFATFMVYLARRAKLAAQMGPADAGRYPLPSSGPQEGTASC